MKQAPQSRAIQKQSPIQALYNRLCFTSSPSLQACETDQECQSEFGACWVCDIDADSQKKEVSGNTILINAKPGETVNINLVNFVNPFEDKIKVSYQVISTQGPEVTFNPQSITMDPLDFNPNVISADVKVGERDGKKVMIRQKTEYLDPNTGDLKHSKVVTRYILVRLRDGLKVCRPMQSKTAGGSCTTDGGEEGFCEGPAVCVPKSCDRVFTEKSFFEQTGVYVFFHETPQDPDIMKILCSWLNNEQIVGKRDIPQGFTAKLPQAFRDSIVAFFIMDKLGTNTAAGGHSEGYIYLEKQSIKDTSVDDLPYALFRHETMHTFELVGTYLQLWRQIANIIYLEDDPENSVIVEIAENKYVYRDGTDNFEHKDGLMFVGSGINPEEDAAYLVSYIITRPLEVKNYAIVEPRVAGKRQILYDIGAITLEEFVAAGGTP